MSVTASSEDREFRGASKEDVADWLTRAGQDPDMVLEVRLTADTMHGLPQPMMEVHRFALDPDLDRFTEKSSTTERTAATEKVWVPVPSFVTEPRKE